MRRQLLEVLQGGTAGREREAQPRPAKAAAR
jgi:hypothetical protein